MGAIPRTTQRFERMEQPQPSIQPFGTMQQPQPPIQPFRTMQQPQPPIQSFGTMQQSQPPIQPLITLENPMYSFPLEESKTISTTTKSPKWLQDKIKLGIGKIGMSFSEDCGDGLANVQKNLTLTTPVCSKKTKRATRRLTISNPILQTSEKNLGEKNQKEELTLEMITRAVNPPIEPPPPIHQISSHVCAQTSLNQIEMEPSLMSASPPHLLHLPYDFSKLEFHFRVFSSSMILQLRIVIFGVFSLILLFLFYIIFSFLLYYRVI